MAIAIGVEALPALTLPTALYFILVVEWPHYELPTSSLHQDKKVKVQYAKEFEMESSLGMKTMLRMFSVLNVIFAIKK